MVFTFHPPMSTELDAAQAGTSWGSEEDPMTLSELQEFEDRSMLESESVTETPASYHASASYTREPIYEDAILLSDFMEDYDVLQKLGEGSFGVVYKIRHKYTREVYARKDIDWNKFSEKQIRDLCQEINTLRNLDHFNIVGYVRAFFDETTNHAHIVMDYCGGGTLHDIILAARGAAAKRSPDSYTYLLTEDRIWRYFAQLVAALDHCHHPNERNNPDKDRKRGPVLHRDLKAANVFLDDNDYVKVGDYGLAKMVEFGELTGTTCGTPMYMAPEIVSRQKYNSSVDIWGLGCIMYELCELEPPFFNDARSVLHEAIVNGHMRPMVSGYSDTLKNLVMALLEHDPVNRPTAEQLMKHERISCANEIIGFETNSDNSKFFLHAYTRKQKETLAACAIDEQRMRLFHANAMYKNAEQMHAMQQRVTTMVTPEAANQMILLEKQKAQARVETEVARLREAMEKEYQAKEEAFLKLQRKRAAEFEAKAANKRRCMPAAAHGFDRRFADLEARNQELDEREADANQRDFDFALQVLIRAAKGHARYADFILAMRNLIEAMKENRRTYGLCKLDPRDLAVIHKAVLHSKTTGSLKMYHRDARAVWFSLLPEKFHVELDQPQIWYEENFPGMGMGADVECPRFPEEGNRS